MNDAKRRPKPVDRDRRALLMGLSAIAVTAASTDVLAQANWLPDSWKSQSPSRASYGSTERPEITLNDLRPNAIPYRSLEMIDALEGAIARFEQIAAKGDWPQIPGSRMIRPEDDDERVPALRRRLEASGELKAGSSGGWGRSYSMDESLMNAVRKFQENHGLRVTGRVERSTIQALNVTAQARLAQLRLNLKRLRDLQSLKQDDRYILVNAAGYQLEAVERGQVQQRHRVIAGRPGRDTPIVQASVRALNFFPFWRVPDSIATLDLIPKLRKSLDYLTQEKIRVVAGDFNGVELDPKAVDWMTVTSAQIKFRQDPGPQNALGLLRIDMPNSEGVYMHDTPMKQLFKQSIRAFSAGCVRVEDVPKLGDWIARYEIGWEQPGRADQVIQIGQPLDLTLTRPIPVYFTYITAWAEPGGSVQFRPDIYGRDGQNQLAAGGERDETDGPAPAPGFSP